MSDNTTTLIAWGLLLAFIVVPLLFAISVWIDRASKKADQCSRGEFKAWCITFRGAAAVFAAGSAMLVFWTFNEVQTEGIYYETNLNAQYVQNINILSTYVSGFEEQLGVANLQTKQIKSIITEAVAGQVNLKDLVAPGQSPLFVAVTQAYPNVTLAQYNQLVAYIQTGRQQFQDGQTNLLHQLSAYDNWQHSGFLIQPAVVYALGFPSSLLHVQINGKQLSGKAAEEQMWKIVENPTAQAAFATGTMGALPLSR